MSSFVRPAHKFSITFTACTIYMYISFGVPKKPLLMQVCVLLDILKLYVALRARFCCFREILNSAMRASSCFYGGIRASCSVRTFLINSPTYKHTHTPKTSTFNTPPHVHTSTHTQTQARTRRNEEHTARHVHGNSNGHTRLHELLVHVVVVGGDDSPAGRVFVFFDDDSNDDDDFTSSQAAVYAVAGGFFHKFTGADACVFVCWCVCVCWVESLCKCVTGWLTAQIIGLNVMSINVVSTPQMWTCFSLHDLGRLFLWVCVLLCAFSFVICDTKTTMTKSRDPRTV